jgi:hypothetical protein
MIKLLPALVAGFLLAGCQEEAKKPNLADQRRSENVEDLRPVKHTYDARMYGLTGLFGRAAKFSTGVDAAMAAVSKQYPTVKTYPRMHWQKRAVLATVVANYQRDKLAVVLSGHSLGADAVLWMAHELAKLRIPVAAMFLYDPTPFAACVPSNVQVVINWRNSLPFQLGGGRIQWCQDPPKGSPRSLKQYDVPDLHTNIDDRADVRAETVKRVGDVIHMIKEMQRD